MVVILACGSGCLASIDTQTYRIGEISFQTEFACVFCNLEAESPTPCQHKTKEGIIAHDGWSSNGR